MDHRPFSGLEPAASKRTTIISKSNSVTTKFKKGDRVKVVRKDTDYGWVGNMDECIGQTFTIARILKRGVKLKEVRFNWPFGSIEHVEHELVAGNVIELDGLKAIVYLSDVGLAVMNQDGEWRQVRNLKGNVVKIGKTNVLEGLENCDEYATEACKRAKAYFSKSYEERQAEWVAYQDIKVGSRVKILRDPKTREDSYGYVHISSMSSMVGDVCSVSTICGNGILLKEGFYWPYSVLEKV